LKRTAYPVSKRFMTIDIGTSPVRSSRWKWFGMRAHTCALGVSAPGAGGIAASRKGPWALSNAKPLKVALSNRFFAEKGLFFLLDHYGLNVTTT
jgi:hypothetical protein